MRPPRRDELHSLVIVEALNGDAKAGGREGRDGSGMRAVVWSTGPSEPLAGLGCALVRSFTRPLTVRASVE